MSSLNINKTNTNKKFKGGGEKKTAYSLLNCLANAGFVVVKDDKKNFVLFFIP
jgi:hypothetical protein